MPALTAQPKPGMNDQQLPGDGAQGEPTAENDGEFLDALGPERLSVGGGYLEHHLGLVRGHDRQVGTGNHHDQPHDAVLERGRLDGLLRDRAAHEGEVGGQGEPLAAEPIDEPAAKPVHGRVGL